LLLLLAFFFPVKFHLHYHHQSKDDFFLFEMNFLGLYIWRRQVPYLESNLPKEIKQRQIDLAQGPGLEQKSNREVTDELNSFLSNVFEISSALKKYGLGGTLFYLFLPRKYRRWVNVAAKLEGKGRFTRLVWRTVVGKQDPAATGMTMGLLWGIKGIATSFLQSGYVFKNPPRIVAIPSFTGTTWETLLDCIFEIKIGHIILAGMKEYISEVVGGRNNAGTPD
jgi:hypothetical protein